MELHIKDQNFAGKILDEILIQIEQEKITVAELIRLRVEQEVAKYNTCVEKESQGFENAKENALNAQTNARPLNRKLVDPEQEVYRTLEAFQQNQLFIMVDDRQIENLEDEIMLNQHTDVSFVQLTPLVGG